jgi:hypothetical protein
LLAIDDLRSIAPPVWLIGNAPISQGQQDYSKPSMDWLIPGNVSLEPNLIKEEEYHVFTH